MFVLTCAAIVIALMLVLELRLTRKDLAEEIAANTRLRSMLHEAQALTDQAQAHTDAAIATARHANKTTGEALDVLRGLALRA